LVLSIVAIDSWMQLQHHASILEYSIRTT